MPEHWFWLLTSLSCIGWYLVMIGYVAWRGIKDITNMLKKIKSTS